MFDPSSAVEGFLLTFIFYFHEAHKIFKQQNIIRHNVGVSMSHGAKIFPHSGERTTNACLLWNLSEKFFRKLSDKYLPKTTRLQLRSIWSKKTLAFSYTWACVLIVQAHTKTCLSIQEKWGKQKLVYKQKQNCFSTFWGISIAPFLSEYFFLGGGQIHTCLMQGLVT